MSKYFNILTIFFLCLSIRQSIRLFWNPQLSFSFLFENFSWIFSRLLRYIVSHHFSFHQFSMLISLLSLIGGLCSLLLHCQTPSWVWQCRPHPMTWVWPLTCFRPALRGEPWLAPWPPLMDTGEDTSRWKGEERVLREQIEDWRTDIATSRAPARVKDGNT